jgi:PAS domain-containing protein
VLLASADEDLRFIRLTGPWEGTLGWLPDDLAGSRILDLVHADDLRGVVHASAGKSTELSFECRMGTRDGSWRRMSMVLRREGERWYVAARDTTERHERLAEAQRVPALGEAPVGHVLRGANHADDRARLVEHGPGA